MIDPPFAVKSFLDGTDGLTKFYLQYLASSSQIYIYTVIFVVGKLEYLLQYCMYLYIQHSL